MPEAKDIDQELERVAQSVGIPPCPGILIDLSAEAKKDDPDFRKIERLVSMDVGLSATLLKTVNSPFYGLRNKISTVSQAVSMLGLSMLSRTVTGLVLRNAFAGKDSISMEHFWDASANKAMAAAFIARQLPGMDKDEFYTFGLFQNCGIPILMQRFPQYKETLGAANESPDRKFTEIEDEAHGTDHATMGYLLTKSWRLPEDLSQAIRYHHEYAMLSDEQTTLSTKTQHLIAVGLLASHAIQTDSGLSLSLEWEKGGDTALAHLGLTAHEFQEIADDLAQLIG